MNKVISREYVEKNYIHKDKIKEILKKWKKQPNYYGTNVIADLYDLLEVTKDADK